MQCTERTYLCSLVTVATVLSSYEIKFVQLRMLILCRQKLDFQPQMIHSAFGQKGNICRLATKNPFQKAPCNFWGAYRPVKIRNTAATIIIIVFYRQWCSVRPGSYATACLTRSQQLGPRVRRTCPVRTHTSCYTLGVPLCILYTAANRCQSDCVFLCVFLYLGQCVFSTIVVSLSCPLYAIAMLCFCAFSTNKDLSLIHI